MDEGLTIGEQGGAAVASGRIRSMANVLFVCVENAGRSQLSEALFARAARGRHEARSAGSAPAARLNDRVVAVLAEQGIDIAGRVPRGLDRADAAWADLVVTMGCGDACPYVPGTRYVDWDLPDPKGMSLEEVRALRDEIATRVEALVEELEPAAIA
jgi:arsenate reductase